MERQMVERDASGTFCILFRNDNALKMDEIQNIFSQYGTVHNIKVGGNSTGYHFIRYRSFNEAISAVNGLKNHPSIKLARHALKNRNNITGAISKDKQNSKGKITQNNKSKNKDVMKNQNCNPSADSAPIWDSARTETPTQELMQSFDQISLHSELSVKNKQQHSKGKNFKPKASNQDSFSNYRPTVPGLIKSNGDQVPGMPVQKKTVVPAEDVVVANLHPSINPAYVLHFLEKYEPISVTKIRTVPKTSIRYCHVYFKSREIAMEVENQYDEKMLSGQKLIVLRPCRLIEEGDY